MFKSCCTVSLPLYGNSTVFNGIRRKQEELDEFVCTSCTQCLNHPWRTNWEVQLVEKALSSNFQCKNKPRTSRVIVFHYCRTDGWELYCLRTALWQTIQDEARGAKTTRNLQAPTLTHMCQRTTRRPQGPTWTQICQITSFTCQGIAGRASAKPGNSRLSVATQA